MISITSNSMTSATGDGNLQFCGLLGRHSRAVTGWRRASQYQILLAFVSVAVVFLRAPPECRQNSCRPRSHHAVFTKHFLFSCLVEWLRRYLPALSRILSSVSVAPAVRRWSSFRRQVPACSRHSFFYNFAQKCPGDRACRKILVTGHPAQLRCCAATAGSAHALNHDPPIGPSPKSTPQQEAKRP